MVLKRLPLPSINAISLLHAGLKAVRTIPGLHKAAFKGFGLNLALYFLVMMLINVGFYVLIHLPLVGWIESTFEGLGLIASITLWFAQITVLLISALLSIRVSYKLMSLWHGTLVTHVIRWFRPEFPAGSTLGTFKAIPAFVWDQLKDVLKGFGLLFLGVIPLIGAPLVFIIGAYLQGRSIVEPYESTINEVEKPVKPMFGVPTRFVLGWSQMALALVPVIGWLLLPLLHIYQIIGFAYMQERRRQVAAEEHEQGTKHDALAVSLSTAEGS